MGTKGVVQEVVEWIHVDWDRNKQRALVNTVLELRVPYNEGNVFTRAYYWLLKKTLVRGFS